MNKKILEALAEDIKQDMPNKVGTELQVVLYGHCVAQVKMVCRIAKQFNPRFNEQRFRKACGL